MEIQSLYKAERMIMIDYDELIKRNVLRKVRNRQEESAKGKR